MAHVVCLAVAEDLEGGAESFGNVSEGFAGGREN